MFYYFITVPLPVTNVMLRQSDFPGDNVNDNSTVDVTVTWNEVRIAFIVLCLCIILCLL